PSNYNSCDPVNKDINGNEGVPDNEAVLHPISRYLGLLDSLEQQQQNYDGDREIVVALIGGVDSNGQPVYADVTNNDPGFQDSFGIGPGCTASGLEPVTAVPPVRMREVAESYDAGPLYSVCESDF